jgi:hypothetical protein
MIAGLSNDPVVELAAFAWIRTQTAAEVLADVATQSAATAPTRCRWTR